MWSLYRRRLQCHRSELQPQLSLGSGRKAAYIQSADFDFGNIAILSGPEDFFSPYYPQRNGRLSAVPKLGRLSHFVDPI